MRMAKRTRLCNCWVRRWRWQTPGGFIRIFVDEGAMRLLVLDCRFWIEKATLPAGIIYSIGYIGKLLAAFARLEAMSQSRIGNPGSRMIEPLSQRELEVLQLIAQGSRILRLASGFSSPWTQSKGTTAGFMTNCRVRRRTEAVVRAHGPGLL